MVNAFLHYLVKYKCKQKTNYINKNLGKWKKNTLDQHCDVMNGLYDTRLC